MRLVGLNRSDAATEGSGRPSLRFAGLLEDLVEKVNSLVSRKINAQESSYSFLITDDLTIVRKTSTTKSQVYTIPASTDVAFDIGAVLEVQNDGSVAMTVAITTDTLTFEANNTTGTRTIAAGGSGRFLKVAATKWKARGEQMT